MEKSDKKYEHFCLYERQRIERYVRKKRSLQFIADKLERSKSNIWYEVKTNSTNGSYDAKKAHHKAYVKRRYSKIQNLKVAMDIDLREYVETQIKDDQSPVAISGRIKHIEKHLQPASPKSIYKFVYSEYGRQIEQHLYQNAVKKKGGPKRGTNITIDGRTSIEQRPKSVVTREEFGHYEGDFIVSGKDGKGVLLVLVERKTRYPFLMYLEKRDTLTVNQAIEKLLGGLPVKSLTLDNDISFQKHEVLSELLDATIYFCHPFASHEKGTVENRNKAVRRYVPKKSDLSKMPLSHFSMVEEKLRTRFMKCLRFKTPKEAFELELSNQQKTPLASGVELVKNMINTISKI
jgi:transposase, IS30 family